MQRHLESPYGGGDRQMWNYCNDFFTIARNQPWNDANTDRQKGKQKEINSSLLIKWNLKTNLPLDFQLCEPINSFLYYVLDVEFSGKQTFKWRLTWKKLIRDYYWNFTCDGKEGNRMRQRKKLDYNANCWLLWTRAIPPEQSWVRERGRVFLTLSQAMWRFWKVVWPWAQQLCQAGNLPFPTRP